MGSVKTLYMLIGLPGSGKPTVLNRNLMYWGNENVPFVYSTDNYIEEQALLKKSTYDKEFSSLVKKATSVMEVGLKKAIEDGQDIWWDQTNLTVKSRKSKLTKVPEDYRKIAVVVTTEKESLDERNKFRSEHQGKTIPFHIRKNMEESFQPPTLDEGFYSIEWIKT